MALQRLAGKRQRNAGRPPGGFSHHAAGRLDAVAGGVFARGLEIGWRICGRVDEALGRQHGVAREHGRKFLLCQSRPREQQHERGRGNQMSHVAPHFGDQVIAPAIDGSRVILRITVILKTAPAWGERIAVR